MRRIAFILVFAILISVFSACSKTDTQGSDLSAADVTLSPKPSEGPTPSAEPAPLAAPEFPPDHWSINIKDAPVIPLDGMSAPEGMATLKDIVNNYSTKQAIEDGCYGRGHLEDNKYVEFGEDILEEYNTKVAQGQPAILRTYQGRIPNSSFNYPDSIYDREFDGEKTITRNYVQDIEMQVEYEEVNYSRPLDDFDDNFITCYGKDETKARNDGCIISEGMQLLYNGLEIWNNFYNKTVAGERACVRLFSVYNASEDLEVAVVTQIEFDGKYFTSTSNSTQDNTVGECTSSVYTDLIVSEYINWSNLKRVTEYTLCYSKLYSTQYINKCIVAYRETDSQYYFMPRWYSPVFHICDDTITLDDFVWPEGKVQQDESTLIDEPRIYEIVPGMDEWKELTLDKVYEICEVPIEEAKAMTTRALVTTVVTYPILSNINTFNTRRMGMDRLASVQPAINELFSRENAYFEIVRFRFDEYEKLSDSDKLQYHLLLDYYERYVLTGIHKISETDH